MAQPHPLAATATPLPTDGLRRDRSIGVILVEAGRLTAREAERILLAQKKEGLPFGQTGLKLGLLTEDDVRFALARQFDFPYVRRDEVNFSDEVVAAYRPFSRQVESLRALRSQLLLRWFGDEPNRRAIAIVSPSRAEGRTRLAANLGVVFSQLGERTCIVDSDMRRPRVHTLFDLPNALGLSTVLSDRSDFAVHRVPGLLDLSVLTSGPIPPNPQELLSRSSFPQLIAQLQGQFDVVIFDSPPVQESADALMLAARAGAALAVSRRHRSKVRELSDLVDRLSTSGTTTVGSVMNDF